MAQVSWNRQLGLAAALFALGTAAYWLEYKHKPEKESSEEKSKRVFSLQDTPVQSISLFDGNKTVTLTCSDFAAKLCKPGDNSKWEVSSPVKLKADDSNVNALLSTLNTLSVSETIDLKDETPEKKAALLKEYGLDPESRKTAKSVGVKTATGDTTLYLGLNHPIGESIFGVEAKNDHRVYLIPNFFKANFDRNLTYWRDKKLLALGAHEVESFKLDGSKTHLSAERKDGQWILHVGSEELDGDSESINSLLSAATFLTAKEFVSDQKTDAKAKAALKGTSPVLSLTLQKEKGTAKDAPPPITLTLFQKKSTQPDSKLYATVSTADPLFELDASAKNRLDKTVKDLRLTKFITSMERFAAKRLEFSGAPIGTTPLVLVSDKGKWINSADKSEVSADKVNGVLEKLSGNHIQEFLTGSAIPSGEKEGLTITLGDEKNNAKQQFVFWKKAEKLYARRLSQKKNEAFLVDPSLVEALPWNKDFFKKSDSKEGPKSGIDKK